MIDLSHWLSSARKELGISQSSLTQLSGLSLPLIQKIEAGQGNPSLKSLQALSGALGFKLDLLRKAAPWEDLSYHGAALSVSSHSHQRSTRSPQSLVNCVFLCLREVNDKNTPLDSRASEALIALLLGIKSAYPTLWKKNFAKKIHAKTLPARPDGRLLKLKRISISVLSEYL